MQRRAEHMPPQHLPQETEKNAAAPPAAPQRRSAPAAPAAGEEAALALARRVEVEEADARLAVGAVLVTGALHRLAVLQRRIGQMQGLPPVLGLAAAPWDEEGNGCPAARGR